MSSARPEPRHMAASLPELPPLGALRRCPSQPVAGGLAASATMPMAPAPSALPRRVAPPSTADARGAEAAYLSRSMCSATGSEGLTRCGSAGALLSLGHHELPPLREMRRGAELEDFFPPSESAKSFAQLGSRHGARGSVGRLALVQMDSMSSSSLSHKPTVSRHELGEDYPASSAGSRSATLQDVERFKGQVSKLTQLRQDRDSYIQDLLAQAESSQRGLDGDMFRSKSQREVSEQLVSQQHEHDQHMEERIKAHATALAQQALLHERELEELRAALRAENERKLAERHAELVAEHRETLERLYVRVDEMKQKLAIHAAGLKGAAAAEVSRGAAAVHMDIKGATWDSSTWQAPKLVPQEGYRPEMAASTSMEAASTSTEAVELALCAVCADLERALIAGQRAMLSRGTRRATFTSNPVKKEGSDSGGDLRSKLCKWSSSMCDSLSHQHLARVFTEWRTAVTCRAAAASRPSGVSPGTEASPCQVSDDDVLKLRKSRRVPGLARASYEELIRLAETRLAQNSLN